MPIITIDTSLAKKKKFAKVNATYSSQIASACAKGVSEATLQTILTTIRTEWKAKLLEVNASNG